MLNQNLSAIIFFKIFPLNSRFESILDYKASNSKGLAQQIIKESQYMDLVVSMINVEKESIQPIKSKIEGLEWIIYENSNEYLFLMLINE